MKYDVRKIREIAERLGVDQETVIQYLRGRSPLQSQEIQADGEPTVDHAQPAAPTERSMPDIMPRRSHG